MTIYELTCLNEDGNIESNGFYFTRNLAEIKKKEIDDYPMNKKYEILQTIIVHEVEE